MIELQRELILSDVEASSSEDAIRQAAACLQAHGYIGSQYVEDVLAREKEYPTGIPADDVAIALPHAFSQDVRKTGVCVLRLKTPVPFANMAMSDDMLPVELVFMLANASDAENHLEDLQDLMNVFSRIGLLADLKNAVSPEDFILIFSRRDEYPEE